MMTFVLPERQHELFIMHMLGEIVFHTYFVGFFEIHLLRVVSLQSRKQIPECLPHDEFRFFFFGFLQ